MKRWNIVLLSFLLSWNIQATATFGGGDNNCRLNVTNNAFELGLEKQLEADLLSGIWTKTTYTEQEKTVKTSLQFNTAGLVGILSECTSGCEHFDNRIWHVEVRDGQTYLVFTNVNAEKENTYLVKQTCKGLTMTNTANQEVTNLDYTPVQMARQMKLTTNTLKGNWKTFVTPEDMPAAKGAFLQYELKSDGSLVKTFGGKKIKSVVQNGYWQVSPDGEHLMMHIADEYNHYTTVAADVSYLAFDELVLGDIPTTSEVEAQYCGDLESFYFHKH